VSRELRIAIAGATGVLGSEVLAVLSESSLAIGELLPVATERSLGQEIEFRGESTPVETELPELEDLDLLFLCAPAAASLDLARRAIRAELCCVDASGALAAQPDLPLSVGPQPDCVGRDQVNVRLARELRGRGDIEITLTVDGQQTNAVRIRIR
jgi:aspartate-semialdehyde dehydrogenase